MSIVKESCTVCYCSPKCSCWRLERDSVNLPRCPPPSLANGHGRTLFSRTNSTHSSDFYNFEARGTLVSLSKGRSTLVSNNVNAARNDLDVPCLRCRCKLSVEVLCDHCQAHLAIKRKLKSFERESIQTKTESMPGLFKAIKKITAEQIFLSPKSESQSLLKRKIAREFSETSIPHDKIKLQLPFLPKVKPRSGIVQGSKKDVQSVIQRIKKIHGYGTPVSSTDTLENERVKHYKKLHPSKKGATCDKSYSSKTKTKKEPKKEAETEKDVGFRIKAKEESGPKQKSGQQKKDGKSRDEKQEKDKTQDKIELRDAKEKRGQKEKDGKSREDGQLEKVKTQGKESRDAKENSGQKEKGGESKEGGQLEKDKTQGKESGDAKEESDQKQKDDERIEGGQLEEDKTQGKESEDAKEKSGQKEKDGESKEVGQLKKDKTQGKESRDAKEKSGQKQKDGERKEVRQLEKDKTQGKESEDAKEKSGQKEESVPNEKEKKETKSTQTKTKKSNLPPPPPPPRPPKDQDAQTFQDVDEEETETGAKGKRTKPKAKRTKPKKEKQKEQQEEVNEKTTVKREKQEKDAKEKIETDKRLVLKEKPEKIDIVRPDVVEYDVGMTKKKEVQNEKPTEKLPELLTAFPTEVEPELESLPKILKKKATPDEEFVKQTTIVKNLPKNHIILETGEPKSLLYSVSHQFKKRDFGDEYSIEEVVDDRPKVMLYALSDRSYIRNGWTQLPAEKVVRKMFVYRTRPAQPEFDWFKNNQEKGTMFYDTGEKLAEINNKGYGRWYYKNGCIALDYHHTKNEASQDRVVVYSNGEPDEEGRKYPVTCLAMFDFMGNGIVYDHNGRIRINYNQTEGMVHDQKIGPASHWKWHSLNDPPLLQTVMVDTFSEKKDPDILNLKEFDNVNFEKKENKDVYDFELENFAKEVLKRQSKKLSTFQIRMKTVKINKQFSLRILEQSRINLQFREGTTDIKMNLGIIIDSQKIVDTNLVDFGPIPNCMLAQATTKSMTLLQQKYNEVKKINLKRSMHENRVRNPMPISSADRMLSGATRPLHLVPPHAHPLVCACPQPHIACVRV